MAKSLNEKLAGLDAKRRKKVEARTAELVAEEMSLRDLRKARARTQVKLAKALGIKQEGVSRIERRSDLMISTLRSYIEAMGGELSLVAQFPDRPPIEVSGIGDLEAHLVPAKTAGRKEKHTD
jgi:DNA-binding XRE family transcriptional regulator